MMILCGLCLCYLIQTSELSRFYQKLDDINKEMQVSQVLNSQPNSIVVVQKLKNMDNEQAKKDPEESKVEHDPMPKFKFCNSQSVKLFKIDFMNPEEEDLHNLTDPMFKKI